MAPKVLPIRWLMMNKTIEDLQRDMEAAAHALDFEEARRIRDRINLMRGGANATEAAEADTSGLVRQRSGAMGLGTKELGVWRCHLSMMPPTNFWIRDSSG